MNAVITGITGFAGSHLAELLARKGYQVRGLGAPSDSLANLSPLISAGDLRLEDVILADLEDRPALERLLDPPPDHLYHLAAQASVPRSWENPRETFRINVLGTLALLERLKDLRPSPRTLFVGSADEYGASANGSSAGSLRAERSSLLTEDTPIQPTNPYSLSKAAADLLCQQTHQREGLPIIRVRAFNHIGPRQSKGFAAADFAHQIAQGEQNSDARTLWVGRLDAVRDFTDVRDMVQAYELAMIKGEPGSLYNICSGKPRSMHELLEGLLFLSSATFEIVQDQALMRASETPCVTGSNQLFVEVTGWSPKIPWSKTLGDILEYQRRQVAQESLQSVE